MRKVFMLGYCVGGAVAVTILVLVGALAPGYLSFTVVALLATVLIAVFF